MEYSLINYQLVSSPMLPGHEGFAYGAEIGHWARSFSGEHVRCIWTCSPGDFCWETKDYIDFSWGKSWDNHGFFGDLYGKSTPFWMGKSTIWLVVSNMTGLFSISYMGCHHSHWRTSSFFKMFIAPPTSITINHIITNNNILTIMINSMLTTCSMVMMLKTTNQIYFFGTRSFARQIHEKADEMES